MKRVGIIMLVVMSFIALVGCESKTIDENPGLVSSEVSYEDCTYRGAFLDGGTMQVGVQLKLEKNLVKEISFRHLEYKDVDYRKEERDETIIGLREQYEEAIDYLVEKDIRESLVDLYEPGNIVKEDIDGFTGATVRSNKVISAIRDGLNRGVYSY